MILIVLLIFLVTLGINYSNFYEDLLLERKANLIFKQQTSQLIDLKKQITPLVTAYLKNHSSIQNNKLLKTNYRCGLDLVKLTLPLSNQSSTAIQIYLLVANKQFAGCKYQDKITSQKLGTQIIYGNQE